MTQELLTALYIAASVLFILSLGGLSDQEKAKKAVWYGIIGMIIAIFGTILGPDMKLDKLLIPALVCWINNWISCSIKSSNDGNAATCCSPSFVCRFGSCVYWY